MDISRFKRRGEEKWGDVRCRVTVPTESGTETGGGGEAQTKPVKAGTPERAASRLQDDSCKIQERGRACSPTTKPFRVFLCTQLAHMSQAPLQIDEVT